MLLETFYEDRTKNSGAGTHKNIRIRYGLWSVLPVRYLECTENNEINIDF